MSRTKGQQWLFNKKILPFYNISGKEHLCKKCNKNIKANREKHYNSCVGILYKEESSVIVNNIKYSKLCYFGCGKDSLFFYKNGKSYCSKLGNSCSVKIKIDSDKKIGIKTHRVTFNGKTPWNKGLTKKNSEKVKELGKLISESFALNGDQRKTKNHTPEMKDYLRVKMHQRYASGWQSTSCGRAKSYPYENPSEGLVHLTGTWEVDFAKALDAANIKWLRNKKRFDYIKPDNEPATYLPDFYIPQLASFIEIKGYRTILDESKFNQFNEPLIVLRKKEIFQIKKWLLESIDITEDMIMELFVGNLNPVTA